MPTPLLSLDAALALLARPPWVNPVDGGTKRQLPSLPIDAAMVEHARVLASGLRGDEATALERWMLHDPEHAAGALLAAGSRDAWMALRLLCTRYEAHAEVLTAAHVLGVREPVVAARLDDALLCHPLEFPQLPARLPAVALRSELAHARRGTPLRDDEVRRLVELAGAPRSFAPHPALPVLRAALADDDRNALATALQRHDDHLRAAARLGDEAMRERLFTRARSSGQPDALCDALVAADPLWWSLLSTCDSAPVSAWARARHDPLDVPPSVPASAEAAVRQAHRAALERAMVQGDRWPRSALHRAARHPVLGPLVAGVVFGCYGVQGLVRWFLLDPGGTAVDGFGTRVELVGRIGVVHPLALSERERRELADRFDGQQPIEQLRRAVYVPMPDGRPDPATVGGAMVPARILGLLERGWQRVGDGDVLRGVAKPVAPGLEIAIELAGVPREELAGFARAAQTMGTVVLGESGSRDASGYLQRHGSWAALDPIGFSEIMREASACLLSAKLAPTWIDPVLAGIHREAMRRAPADEHAVLAWAELLRKHHHPEGELIELDLRERQGRLDDPIALERLLELAGLLGFPRLPDDPDEDLLAFRPQGGTAYAIALGGRVHRIGYEGGVLTIEDGRARRVLRPRLSSPDRWSDEETTVILATALTNFREQRGLEALWLPGHEAFVGHPRHRVGPWPLYPFPAGVRPPAADADAAVGVRARDRPRWTQLWHKLQVMLGDRPTQRL